MSTRKLLLAAIGVTLALGGATAASASPYYGDHPRRAEVNHRLHNLDHRIGAERRDGEISGARAHRLYRADRHIRRQEDRYAMRHGGHISRHEQARLNHEENRLSHRLG